MTFLVSLAVAVIFGAGAYLILQRNLIRVVVGIVLISNAAILFIIAAGLSRGRPPVLPIPEGETASDPLVQAMALTALVISSSITALLLAFSYRLYVSHNSMDIQDLSRAEVRAAEALEEGANPERDDTERRDAENEVHERAEAQKRQARFRRRVHGDDPELEEKSR